MFQGVEQISSLLLINKSSVYRLMAIYLIKRDIHQEQGAAVVEWLNSWRVEQEAQGSIPGLAT